MDLHEKALERVNVMKRVSEKYEERKQRNYSFWSCVWQTKNVFEFNLFWENIPSILGRKLPFKDVIVA